MKQKVSKYSDKRKSEKLQKGIISMMIYVEK